MLTELLQFLKQIGAGNENENTTLNIIPDEFLKPHDKLKLAPTGLKRSSINNQPT